MSIYEHGINTNENIVLIDIDNTLILYNIKDYPVGRWLKLDYYGMEKTVVAHLEHIDLLKSYHERGFFIRVHTNNGYKWAVEVIYKLGLESYVHSYETKPCKFIDDAELPNNEIIGQRVFIKDTV